MLEGSQKYVSNYSVLYRQRYNVTTDFEAVVDVLIILADKITKVDKTQLKTTLMSLPSVQSQITQTYDAIMKVRGVTLNSCYVYIKFSVLSSLVEKNLRSGISAFISVTFHLIL